MPREILYPNSKFYDEPSSSYRLKINQKKRPGNIVSSLLASGGQDSEAFASLFSDCIGLSVKESAQIDAGYCHTGESRYPVTFKRFNKAKVAGFRVKPGMTAKDLRVFSNRKCCPRNLFWTRDGHQQYRPKGFPLIFPHLSSCTRSITVTSGGARNRMGGPQVPVPLLTYNSEPIGRFAKPACVG